MKIKKENPENCNKRKRCIKQKQKQKVNKNIKHTLKKNMKQTCQS